MSVMYMRTPYVHILLTVHAVFVEFVDFVSIRIVQMRVYVCMTRLHAGL